MVLFCCVAESLAPKKDFYCALKSGSFRLKPDCELLIKKESVMKRVHFLVMVFFFWGGCCFAEFNLRNVIELVDNGAGENAYKRKTSVLRFLNSALQQQRAVIVVSGVMMHMWLQYARFFERELSAQQDVLAKKDNFDIVQELDAREAYLRSLSQAYPSEVARDFLAQKILAISTPKKSASGLAVGSELININELEAYRCYKMLAYLKNWRIFHYQSADTFLLVPKDVELEKIKQSFNVDVRHEIVGGIEPLYVAVRGWNNLADRIKDCLPVSIKYSFDHYASVKFAGLCCIGATIAVGCGIGVIPALIGASIAWGCLVLVNQYADFIMHKKRLYFPYEWPVYVKNLYNFNASGTWAFFRIGHGAYTPGSKRNGKPSRDALSKVSFERIAGIPVPDALDRLYRFGLSEKMLAAIDITCYGGGYHAQQISKTLSALSPVQQYLYCMVALTDASPSNPYAPGAVNFDELFDDLRMLERKEQTVPASLVLLVALSSLRRFTQKHERGERNIKIPNNPLVFVPGAKKMIALNKQPHILTIADEQLQSNVIPEECEACLLYSPQVKTPLFIRRTLRMKCPVFVSMIPGDTIHQMASIDINVPLDGFVKESFFNFPEWCQKDFLIDHLKCQQYQNSALDAKEYLDLEQVIIHKEPANTFLGFFIQGEMRIAGHVYCKLAINDKYYRAALEYLNMAKRGVTLDPFVQVSKKEFEMVWNKAQYELAYQDSWPYEPIELLLDQWFARG